MCLHPHPLAAQGDIITALRGPTGSPVEGGTPGLRPRRTAPGNGNIHRKDRMRFGWPEAPAIPTAKGMTLHSRSPPSTSSAHPDKGLPLSLSPPPCAPPSGGSSDSGQGEHPGGAAQGLSSCQPRVQRVIRGQSHDPVLRFLSLWPSQTVPICIPA